MKRRELLGMAAASAAGFLLPGCPRSDSSSSAASKVIAGRIHGQDATLGHLLRSGELAAREAGETREVETLIVGGGVAGLSAAWRLTREGAKGVVVVDAAPEAGGNSRAGRNPTSRFPWGAHYLRAPTAEHRSLEVFLEEAGLIRGRDAKGLLDWDTRAVCPAPQERVYEGGLWGEGLFPPPRSRSDASTEQYERFYARADAFAKRRDAQGRRAFAIPLELSARDDDLMALDTQTFAAWLQAEGFTDKALLWYLDYACRDDFGCTLETASAWAGLHYFCARRGGTSDREVVLAWPEGNAHLVELLAKGLTIEPSSLCVRIQPGATGEASQAWIYSAEAKSVTRIVAKQLIFAGPQFVLARLLPEAPAHTQAFTYAPWLVATVTFTKQPGGIGAPLAWDNVLYGSPSLGYVVANRSGGKRQPCVVTWYYPLTGEPAAERERLLAMDHAAIAKLAVDDLCSAHPLLRGRVRSVDAWRWGHAMIRPVPGFLWGKDREAALTRDDALICANSDLSGISIFEEAFYRGVVAGEAVLTRTGASFKSLL